MSALIEMVSGHVVTPGVVSFTPLTPVGGDSFQIRDFDMSKYKAYLLAVVPQLADFTGVLRIRSMYFHDIVNGLQYIGGNGNHRLSPMNDFYPELYAGDILQIDAQGSTVGTDVWNLIIYYENATGFKARYLDFDFVRKYKKRVFNIATPASFVIAGTTTYETPIASNLPPSVLNALEYDRYYAIVATGGSSPLTTMGSLRSQEWGNVRYPVNGNTIYPFTDLTRFLSDRSPFKKLIPFFHSDNVKQLILEFICSSSGSGSMFWDWHIVELTQEANALIEQMGEQIPTAQDRSLSQ
jgi:hypothetical protein